VLDGRTHRTPNWPRPRENEAYFGKEQIAWLGAALASSRATWKIVASPQPLGLFLEDRTPEGTYEPEGVGNQPGPPSGREIELAGLFSTLKSRKVENVIWITADVHYAAAHHYDPAKAIFRDMDPFWEFVAGPMHATSFGWKRLDDTFGIEVAYASGDGSHQGTPATGEQFFGLLAIDGKTRALTVTLVDAHGRDLHKQTFVAT
jgi:alkaline phosphatase D